MDKIIQEMKTGDEFEGLFDRQLTARKFQSVLEQAVKEWGKENLIEEQSLDVLYTLEEGQTDSLRFTVRGPEAIDSVMRTFFSTPNTSLVSIMASRAVKGDGSPDGVPPVPMVIIKEKEKYRSLTFEDEQYDVKYRLSHEREPDKEFLKKYTFPGDLRSRSIVIRFKHRVSAILHKDKECTIRLDMTAVRSGFTLGRVVRSVPSYEVELDLTAFGSPVTKSKIFESSIPKIISWIQGYPKVITKAKSTQVLEIYKGLVETNTFYQMRPVSLDGNRFLNLLPHNYAVTDKADGETVQLLILDGEHYIITPALEVCDTGVSTTMKGPTLAEGELVLLDTNAKKILLYDLLYLNGEDQRQKSLKERIESLDVVIGGGVPTDHKQYAQYLRKLDGLITRKIYLYPDGVDRKEIYSLSEKMWTEMTDLPYQRDGLIFTGIDQIYTSLLREQIHPILKWKPPEMNSIDFYVEFLKTREGGIDLLFDRTSRSVPADRPFIVANLLVGRKKAAREFPVPFLEKMGLHKAHLYVTEEDPVPRDVQGYPIEDMTVVEMVYQIDSIELPEKRWTVIRTRHDKTARVRNTRTGYGNNEEVASKIWETIINPIRLEDFIGMALSLDYSVSIQERLIHTTVEEDEDVLEEKRDAYYQKQTTQGKAMRDFHNHVKELLISSYCTPLTDGNRVRRATVLDIGIGRGGDILKYYHAKVHEVIGIDPDEAGLFHSSDCASARYASAVDKFPGFPPMVFLRADAGVPLDPVHQMTRFGTLSKDQRVLLKKHMRPKYDVINIQFAIHYMMTSANLPVLCKNINNLLVSDGIVIVTTFHAGRVREYLGGVKERKTSYIDTQGIENVLFIIRDVSIDPKGEPGLNQAIDFHTSLFMDEDTFRTEYLVYPETLIDVFHTDADLILLDDMPFSKVLDMCEEYGVGHFFSQNESVEEASRTLSELNHLYIFQKGSKK